MSWQNPTVASYRECLQRLVEVATSQHVSAVAVNAGGSGYTDGDLLTITHAGATMPLTFVVAVTAGAVTAIKRIVQNGAFSNRVATVAINAAGTGYAANDIVRLTTGTFRQYAKAKVTTVGGGGAATAVAVFEGGGAYSSVPTATGGATNSDIGTGTGSGLTLDTTMTGLIGTTGISATGGTGTSATFNLTLTETGWTALQDRNDYSLNSVTDEKEVILEGTAGGGEETPLVGIRTGTNGSGGTLRHFLSLTAFTSYNSGLSYSLQPNAINPDPTTSAGNLIGMVPTDTTVVCWFSVTSRKLAGVVRADGSTVTSYHSFYAGLLNPHGTSVENPYPMVLMASYNGAAIAADAVSQLDISGITECYNNSSRTGPCYAWDQANVTWQQLENGDAASGSPPFTARNSYVVFPVGNIALNTQTNDVDVIINDGPIPFTTVITRSTGAASTMQIKPTPNTTADLQPHFPVTVVFGTGLLVFGDLDNVYWVSGTKADGSTIAPEDTFTIGNRVFRVFTNAARTESYSFFLMEEGV